MEPDPIAVARDARMRIARLLAELHKLHLSLAQESRGLKQFSGEGLAQLEVEIAAELLEQYLGESDAFLENMRGRFEARLGTLRRGEPRVGQFAEAAPGHGAFWLAFSRLCVALKRAERRV